MYSSTESEYYVYPIVCLLTFFAYVLITISNLSHRHVGGLFTGNAKYPGLAGLKESGELLKML